MMTKASIVPAIIELPVVDESGVATGLDLYVAPPGTFVPLPADAIVHSEDTCEVDEEIDRLARYVGAWNLADSPLTCSKVRALLRVPRVRWQVAQGVARLRGGESFTSTNTDRSRRSVPDELRRSRTGAVT